MATIADINSHGKYALNPRGNLWLNDKDKFGERLMKKMGWSKGKGLGKNENGVKENIKVRLKNNNSGVGWKSKSTDIGSSDYDLVLSDLWQNHAPRKEQCNDSSFSDGSLEGRSQKFKNRLHYRKFVLGKDISQYSEKDMKSIFVSKPNKEIESSNQENEEQEAIVNGFQDKLTKNVLNLVDYFNQKLKQKKNKETTKNGISSLDSATESAAKCFASDTSDNEQGAECSYESVAKTKTCKKRKKSQSEILENENGIVYNNGLDASENNCETEEPRKKKKRKISAVRTDTNDSHSSKFCSPDSSPTKKAKHKKRLKTDLIEETSSENNTLSSLNIEETLLNSGVALKNKKRKKTTELYTKAKKLKTNAILNLKSCLKRNLPKSSLKKQVSFCRDISFRTFDNELAVDTMDEEQVSSINAPELELDLSDESIDDKTTTEISERTLNESAPVKETVTTESETDLESSPSETVSPIKRSSVYNSWLDSHRQALKMKMYKSMYKNIKEHYIFQSTNLTQIKGYGNWGY